MSKKTTLIALCTLMCLAGYAQIKPLPFDSQVRTGKLKNGFTYYIRHNIEPKNRVTLYLVNKVGSVLENDDQRGLAHFMEHMTFNGSKHFPKNTLMNYLQNAGVRFGADINAYTGYDETVYQLPIPTDQPGSVEKGLQIIRDWAQDATLDPKEIDKERGVVLEEKRLGKGAAERLQRQYYPMIMNHSRYADRSPIGTDEVLTNFKPETIKSFYHDWYRPDLQALVVVGDVDINAIETSIKARFADLKNPPNEKKRTAYSIPLTGKSQFIALTDKEYTATVAEVMIKHPAIPLRTAADYRSVIIRNLFNGMMGERFAELMQQADAPFIQGNAAVKNFMSNVSTYSTTVVAKPGELEKGFKALWRETERIKKFGFNQTELNRAKANYLAQITSAVKEKSKTSSDAYVQEYVDHFLKGTASPGIDYEYQLVKTYLPAISLTDIDLLSKTYIGDNNRDIILLAPDKEKENLPDEKTFIGWMKSVNIEQLQPYTDHTSSLPLLTQEPIAGKIISEEKNTALGLTTLKLSNGVTVILKPTDFKNDEILFRGNAPGGTSLYSDQDSPSAANAAGIIGASGAGNYNAAALDKFLAGKQLDAKPYIGERYQGIEGGASPTDLATALQLTYAYLTEPRKDTSVFQAIIGRTKARLANRSNDPNSAFADTVTSVLGNHNIRRTGPSIEKLKRISLNRSFDIYRDRFADASQMTFIFTGSFNADTIKPLIEKYLGSLPNMGRKEKAKDLGIHIPDGRITKTVYKGTEPKATVTLVYSGLFDDSPANRIKFDAIQECLNIRLIERLREDESGVYSPSVSINTTKFPESRFSLIIRFGCAPQNADKLVASAMDEVNKLKTEGPLNTNINKWKAEYSRQKELQLKENGWWLDYLSNQLQNQDALDQFKTDGKLSGELSQQALKTFAKKYLPDNNFIRLQLLPENLRP
ncbi:M16 family metallopeptidase [Mucilaginibacter celer]|uniref:Insulinase family protein n=1 Tax=Mucilaginibacter celer TaxID=2305508 RepID=A0A494VKB1_9SPHI|nr:insulinase family protein [Mucilaginibacter celer]AYL94369.1 insulinase family protein [Mucilaginibacter celer]